MILYHAGLAKIDKFDLSKGCHFGSKESALEAALRKVELFAEAAIYLHKVSVPDEVMRVYETFDAGCEENWKSVIEFAVLSGHNTVKYMNKYEPSSCPSFILLEELTDCVVLESVVTYNSGDVEQYLTTCF